MKKNIALLTGGWSEEAQISYKSTAQIEKSIPHDKYNVYKINIDTKDWTHTNDEGSIFHIDKNDFSLTIEENKIKFDGVFIGIHGSPGEDGILQAYFDIVGIPYTGCDSATSALTFNKSNCNNVVSSAGIAVAASMQLFKNSKVNTDKISEKLNLPIFVKPNNGGSSIGMSKVNRWQELQDALNKAFNEDDQILIEEYITGREFTCGIFNKRDQLIVLPVTEIIPSKEFFDFEEKYLKAGSNEITPADLDEDIVKMIHEKLKIIYKKLNCYGVVRIDFILEKNTGTFYFLEVNTIPGQTENSIIPQQVKSMGIKIEDFYTQIIESAFEKNL